MSGARLSRLAVLTHACVVFFFFQAEDGIRDDLVTGVQTCALPISSLGKGWGVLHELGDQRAVAAGVAGLARSAHGAQDVRDHLRAAFATLYAPRARPAYLEIPLDLLPEPTILRPERFARSGAASPPAPAALAAAQALLAEAQRPLIIAGGGARRAGGALRQLVEALHG